MGTTSSFFGGGGGATVVKPSIDSFKNLTYLNNTEVAYPQSSNNLQNDYQGFRLSSWSDTHFSVLSRGSSNHLVFQLFVLNDDGSATQVGSSTEIGTSGQYSIRDFSGSNQVGLGIFSENSTGKYHYWKIVWDGNTTITATKMGESSNTGHIETTVLTTVLYDGRLQANDGQYSNNGYQNTVQLNTDGNGNVDTNRSTNMARSTSNHYFCGLGMGYGIIQAGRYNGNTNRCNVHITYPSDATMNNQDHAEAYLEVDADSGMTGFALVPTPQGGGIGHYITNEGTNTGQSRRKYFGISGHAPDVYETQPGSFSGSGTKIFSNYSFGTGNQGKINWPLKRCYDGSYQDKDGRIVTFDHTGPWYQPKSAFSYLKKIAGSNSATAGTRQTAQCVVKDKIISGWFDNNSRYYNLNVYQFA
jgi:hypothetical protein